MSFNIHIQFVNLTSHDDGERLSNNTTEERKSATRGDAKKTRLDGATLVLSFFAANRRRSHEKEEQRTALKGLSRRHRCFRPVPAKGFGNSEAVPLAPIESPELLLTASVGRKKQTCSSSECASKEVHEITLPLRHAHPLYFFPFLLLCDWSAEKGWMRTIWMRPYRWPNKEQRTGAMSEPWTRSSKWTPPGCCANYVYINISNWWLN